MAENFPNLEKETHIQIQETPRYQKNKKNKPKRPTPRHIIIKMSKVKDKENLCTLLGVWIGASAVEGSMVVPKKTKDRSAL